LGTGLLFPKKLRKSVVKLNDTQSSATSGPLATETLLAPSSMVAPQPQQFPFEKYVIVAALLGTVATWVTDISVEGMFIGGVLPYFLVIFVCCWANDCRAVVVVTTLASLALILGSVMKEPMPELFYINRAIIFIALWIAALMTVREINLRTRLRDAQQHVSDLAQHRQEEMNGRIKTLENKTLIAADIANVGFWEYYIKGDRTVFSPKYETMLGCGPGEHIETFDQWCARVDPDSAAYQRSIVNEFAAGGHSGSYTAQYHVDFPNGSRRHFMTRSAPMVDDSGYAYGLLGADTDVTDFLELTEELRKARDAAEDASRAKSAFLANVSHELRTPLNAIIGFSDLMSSETLGPIENERYKSYIADIRRAGGHLLILINDILDLSKVESGKFTIETQPTSIARTLEHVFRFFEPQIGEKNLKVDMDVIDAALTIQVDKRHFRQILMNLVSNAIKFSHPGGTIRAKLNLSRAGKTKIIISDGGIGIERTEVERVFQPFQQVAAAFTRQHQGTGLGLSIARSLAKSNGGTVHVESAGINIGTNAILTFLQNPDRSSDSLT